MFADTDFLLAIIKDSDWLKVSALTILKKHKGIIKTSVSVMIEVAHLCKRLRMNTVDIFAHIFELINVDDKTYAICMQAAVYIDKYNATVFDAFHAAYCSDDIIISSDRIYDELGMQRLRLEKQK